MKRGVTRPPYSTQLLDVSVENHNFYHNLSTWLVVSGGDVDPYRPTTFTLLFTTCQVGKLRQKLWILVRLPLNTSSTQVSQKIVVSLDVH